ncbi:MAG TPA: response regulator transcription factor [Candidatus Acidoferrales bacterium]|jgi:DNA-binding NarL/FixJ family response regulator|nr:response regulator transcription factor [Candidatus Acidoferrales bacterium]
MMQRLRVLLLDDHVLFREGLRRLLVTEPDFETVAECGTPAEAVEVLSRTAVDVVLLDFDLGDETGTGFVAHANQAGYKGKILMVTAGMIPLDVTMARNLGVSGIFLKHNSPATLLEAIRHVARGGEWMDSRAVPSDSATTDEPGLQAQAPLTLRELQVLRSVFEGLTNKEIAHKIGASQSSVKATLQRLFEKTGVRTRAQLVRIAIERSLETARQS